MIGLFPHYLLSSRRGNKSFYVRLQCFEFSFELFLEKTRKKLEEQFPHNEEVILKLTKQNKCSINNRQNQIFVVELAYKCNTKKWFCFFIATQNLRWRTSSHSLISRLLSFRTIKLWRRSYTVSLRNSSLRMQLSTLYHTTGWLPCSPFRIKTSVLFHDFRC